MHLKCKFYIQCFLISEHQTMVKKLWFRDIIWKAFLTKTEPQARVFSEPKMQQCVTRWYILYRWFIWAAWVMIIVCSLFEIGCKKPIGGTTYWPIYLTNWDLVLGMSQALLGVILVHRRWKLQKDPNFDPSKMECGKLEKIYWFLYVATTSIAIGVTVIYWGLVHDPEFHQIDTLNIMLHVCNSILMIIDFCVVSIPFKLRFFWWCVVIATFYLMFSAIYFLAGGLDKYGRRFIYKVLDWEKPVQALIVCTGGLIFIVLVHCSLHFLGNLRDRLYERKSKTKSTGAVDDNPTTNKPEDVV